MTEKKTTTKEYFRAIGRRKTAIAVVRLYKASKNSYTINGKDFTEYFPTPELKIHAASGTESATLQREVLLLQGMWYVNNLGYFRYYTAADFTLTIPFGIDFARNTLLDTVLTLSEDSSQKE